MEQFCHWPLARAYLGQCVALFCTNLGNPRGTWRLNGTGPVWTYDATEQRWTETGTSHTQYFPPFLPEQVIVQHQEILSAYDYLTTREIPDGTTHISWEDGFESLLYDYTTGAWTWTAPDYESNGNSTSEWKDDVEFESPSLSYSERWSITENDDPKIGGGGGGGGAQLYQHKCSNS